MVHMIAGRAGSGKSRRMYEMAEAAMEAGKRVYLIVPDQATFQTEWEMAKRRPQGGMAGSGVLSFSRLCDRVLQETGGAARPYLSERGAVMAVSMLLLRHREEFATFGGYVNSPSFAALLYQQLCELRRFSIGPEELREMDSPRVRDMALMLEAYQKDILSRYTDVVGRMEMMVGRIPEAPMLRGSHVFIDGFEMVTDQLLRAVGAIMETAEEVAVTFRLGQENDRDFPIFETELSHYKRIEKLALSAGKRLHPVPLYGKEAAFRQRSPMLRHLEAELFSLPYNVYRGPYDGSVLIREAAHGREEAAAAARYIAYLVREEGLRYRDIFVQLCDPGLSGLLREEFEAHGIPCFLDEKRPVMLKTVCRFGLALLKCAVSGMARDDVLALLKTGLFPVSEEEAAFVQNYMVERGLRYLSARAAAQEEDPGARRLLERVHRPLSRLRAELRGNAAAMARAFYAAMAEYEEGIAAFLGGLVTEDPEAADEEKLAYEALMGILTQMDAMMGEALLTPGEFYQTVRAGLLAEEIAVLPPTADCVSVGDMDRSRAASVECLLVLGANDGCLPRTPRPSSILPQREVERMEAAGLWLGNDAQLRMAEEEWTVYGAFSKPKGRLYLSYSALDGRGTPRGRSPVVSDLLRLFPELRVYPAQAYGNARGYAVTVQSGAAAARTAAGAYGRGEAVDGSFGALYRVCRDRMGWKEPDLHRLNHLDEGLAEELFLPKGAVSATRMERYARCPFSHFVESGLRPQEIREPGVAPRDRGDILHEALEKVVALRKGDWTLGREEIQKLALEVVEKIFAQRKAAPGPRDGYQKKALGEAAQEAFLALFAQLRDSGFQPVGVEDFFREGALIQLPGRRPVRVMGKIDRVDLATVHGRRYVRVVDYKSGKASYDLEAIREGTDLQLPIYAAAAQEATGAQVAGMFLMPVGRGDKHRLDGVALGEDDVVNAMDPALMTQNKSEILPIQRNRDGSFSKRSGVGSQESLEEILNLARTRTGELVEAMLEGDCQARPNRRANPCRFCAYGGICRRRGGEREEGRFYETDD